MNEHDATPDESAVEYLIERIRRGWIDGIPRAPESELDAGLMDCRVLRGKARQKNPVDDSVLRIVAVTLNGEKASANVWDQIRSCPDDSGMEISCYVCGVGARLLIDGGMKNGLFHCECVYNDRTRPGCSPGDEAFGARIRE